MKKVTYDNKEYVKASEVAKKFKYTQDYVGQLCRSGKVDARLIGRSWYVELLSVTKYRKQKHATQKKQAAATSASTKAVRKSTPRTAAGKKVAPVVRSKTLRLVRDAANSKKHTRKHTSIQYEAESVSILPISNKSVELEPPATITSKVKKEASKVDLVPESRKIIVRSKRPTQETKFVSAKLPEISLSGNLPVQESNIEMTEVGEVISTQADLAQEVQSANDTSNQPNETQQVQKIKRQTIAEQEVKNKDLHIQSDESLVKKTQNVNTSAASLNTSERNGSFRPTVLSFAIVCVACVIGGFLLMIGSATTVTANVQTSSIQLNNLAW